MHLLRGLCEEDAAPACQKIKKIKSGREASLPTQTGGMSGPQWADVDPKRQERGPPGLGPDAQRKPPQESTFNGTIAHVLLEAAVVFSDPKAIPDAVRQIQRMRLPVQPMHGRPDVIVVSRIPAAVGDGPIRQVLAPYSRVISDFRTRLACVLVFPDGASRGAQPAYAGAEAVRYQWPRDRDRVVCRVRLVANRPGARPVPAIVAVSKIQSGGPDQAGKPQSGDQQSKDGAVGSQSGQQLKQQSKQQSRPTSQQKTQQKTQQTSKKTSGASPDGTSGNPSPMDAALSQLGQDIGAFCNDYLETKDRVEQRQELFSRLRSLVQGVFPCADLALFGSCAVGLGSQQSDIDLCVFLDDSKEESHVLRAQQGEDIIAHVLGTIGEKLEADGYADVKPLLTIRIPIVKCKDEKTQIESDISMTDATVHEKKTSFFRRLVVHPIIRKLIVVVKYWSGRRRLRGSRMLNSYAWQNLVIQYLQVDASILFGDDGDRVPDDAKTIATLMVRFFRYYFEFDWSANAVSVSNGRPESLAERERAQSDKKHSESVEAASLQSKSDFPSLVAGLQELGIGVDQDPSSTGASSTGASSTGASTTNTATADAVTTGAAPSDNTHTSTHKSTHKSNTDIKATSAGTASSLGKLGFQKGQLTSLCIVDPIDSTDNIARNLRLWERGRIQSELKRALLIVSDPNTCSFKSLCANAEWSVMQFLVPRSQIGLVIGAKGANAQRVREQTGVRLIASNREEGIKWRSVRLDGPPNIVLRGVKMLLPSMMARRTGTLRVLIPDPHVQGALDADTMTTLRRNGRARVRGLPGGGLPSNMHTEYQVVELNTHFASTYECVHLILSRLMAVGATDGAYQLPAPKSIEKKDNTAVALTQADNA